MTVVWCGGNGVVLCGMVWYGDCDRGVVWRGGVVWCGVVWWRNGVVYVWCGVVVV